MPKNKVNSPVFVYNDSLLSLKLLYSATRKHTIWYHRYFKYLDKQVLGDSATLT